MAQITYGKVANTRHSAKHCTGTVRKSRSAIIAGNVHLCTSVSREEILRREAALDLRPVEYDFVVSDGVVVPYEVKPVKQVVKETEHDFKEMFKPFKPLQEPTVKCSARGGHNGGTKDKSVSCTISASPDVDNVSSMTGVISLSRDGHHKTKILDNAYNKERLAFREAMDNNYRMKGKPQGRPAHLDTFM